MSESGIEMILCCDATWWSARAHRSTLPLILLNWGVIAIIVFYDEEKYALAGKPLFDDRAWTNAKTFLRTF